MKAFFLVTDAGLKPHDEATQNYMANRQAGEVIAADIVRARNYENHKRFFSFIETSFDMQEHFDEIEAYRKWLTMKAGYFDTLVAPNGYTMFTPKSIAFEKMDEDEFKALFDTVIDVFIKELGKGITDDEMMRIIDYG